MYAFRRKLRAKGIREEDAEEALAAFDDERAKLALILLRELSGNQQILLFTCHKREGEILEELT